MKNVTADTYQRAGVATTLYGVGIFDVADGDKRKLEIIERQVGRWTIVGDRGTGCESIYGKVQCWHSIPALNEWAARP